MNIDEILSKPDICRICLKSSDGNFPFVDITNCTAFKENLKRYDMLVHVFQAISVSVFSDTYRHKICSSCDNRLLQSLKFLELCTKSEEFWKPPTIEHEAVIKLERVDEGIIDCMEVALNKVISKPDATIKREKQHTCNTCGKKFITSQRLTSHVTKFHTSNGNKLPYDCEKQTTTCDGCDDKFFSSRQLTLHQSKCQAIKPIQSQDEPGNAVTVCNLCGEKFPSTHYLTAHRAKCPVKVESNVQDDSGHLTCDCCNKKFQNKKKLTVHLQKNLPVKCHCGMILLTPRHLQKHQYAKHGTSKCKRKHNCSLCGKYFRNNDALVCHENVHRGIKPYLCSSCPLSFHGFYGLKAHSQRHHEHIKKAVKKRAFLCDTCGSSFSRKAHLKRHTMYTHTPNLPRSFSCNKCNKAFSGEDRLKTHMRIHNPRDIFCPECDKSFHTRFHCKIHINRVHLQLRPYPCTTCDMSFKVKAHLHKHMRTHTGEKPHQCPHCVYQCAEKSNLQKHIRIHERIK